MAVCGLGRGASVGAEPAAVVDTPASAHPDKRAPLAGAVGAVHADRAGRIGGRRSDCYGRRALALHLGRGRRARVCVGGCDLVAVLRPSGRCRAARIDDVDRRLLVRTPSVADRPRGHERRVTAADPACRRHLGTGAGVAFLGGAVVFIVSLIATRLVTVRGSHRRGVSVKLGAAAVILGLLAIQSVVPPLAVAAGLAAVLASLVFVERMLGPGHETLCRCISAEEVT